MAELARLLAPAPTTTRAERACAILAGRFAELLARLPSAATGPLADARAFLEAKADEPFGPQAPADALDRLVGALELSELEVDLLVLAGLAEEHEGYASVLRQVHPRSEPAPSIGLAAQLLCPEPEQRRRLREALASGLATRLGALVVGREGPFPERSLHLADALWPVLCAVDAWPEHLPRIEGTVTSYGLEDWLDEPPARRALRAVAAGRACTVLVTADSEEVALGRAAALAAAAGVATVRVVLPAARTPADERLVAVHALARGVVAVLRLDNPEPPGAARVPAFDAHPAPVVVAARAGAAVEPTRRPLLMVPSTPLDHRARRRMWRAVLPALADDAPQLAARHVVEPAAAAVAAADAQTVAALERRPPQLDDVTASLRARAAVSLAAGVRLLRPTATWEQLVLPAESRALLEDALTRLVQGDRVLDDWRFLAGRSGARGVRMLFAGPPGTGKTLSAEVLAGVLGSDLLLVDLSRVVSKWIGETEKNLAEVFEAAERAQAVLLFDEADALFGKRTEVSDAHDRYANLETAYLLMRLERFEGLAILASNLRGNIDPAFMRRLEFVVEFDEPGLDERRALWYAHLPAEAPLGRDVSVDELAELYPVPGGLIRNAAVAAAFLAAADDSSITRSHLVRAMRREYQKSGRAFPGLLADTTA